MVALNEQITVDEVELALSKLPNIKAAGADGITAECLKATHIDSDGDIRYILAPVMADLFNTVFLESDFPSQFAIIH